jgi:hypothetical protein
LAFPLPREALATFTKLAKRAKRAKRTGVLRGGYAAAIGDLKSARTPTPILDALEHGDAVTR